MAYANNILSVIPSNIYSDILPGIISDAYRYILLTFFSDISFLAYLLTFCLAFCLANLLTFYLAFYVAYLLTVFLAYLLTFYLAFYLAYLLTLTFLLASSDSSFGILSGISFDFLSGILSGISTDMSSAILSGNSSDILSGILSCIPSDILFGILSGILIFSGILSGCWGPAVPTAIWCCNGSRARRRRRRRTAWFLIKSSNTWQVGNYFALRPWLIAKVLVPLENNPHILFRVPPLGNRVLVGFQTGDSLLGRPDKFLLPGMAGWCSLGARILPTWLLFLDYIRTLACNKGVLVKATLFIFKCHLHVIPGLPLLVQPLRYLESAIGFLLTQPPQARLQRRCVLLILSFSIVALDNKLYFGGRGAPRNNEISAKVLIHII